MKLVFTSTYMHIPYVYTHILLCFSVYLHMQYNAGVLLSATPEGASTWSIIYESEGLHQDITRTSTRPGFFIWGHVNAGFLQKAMALLVFNERQLTLPPTSLNLKFSKRSKSNSHSCRLHTANVPCIAPKYWHLRTFQRIFLFVAPDHLRLSSPH